MSDRGHHLLLNDVHYEKKFYLDIVMKKEKENCFVIRQQSITSYLL